MSFLTRDIGQWFTSKTRVTWLSWALGCGYGLFLISIWAKYLPDAVQSHALLPTLLGLIPLTLFWIFVPHTCFLLRTYDQRPRWDLLCHALNVVPLFAFFVLKQTDAMNAISTLLFLLFSLLGGYFGLSRRMDYQKSHPQAKTKENGLRIPALLKCFLACVPCLYILFFVWNGASSLWFFIPFVLISLLALFFTYKIHVPIHPRLNYLLLSILAFIPYILCFLADDGGWLLFYLLIGMGLFWFIAGIWDIGLIAWSVIAKIKRS